MLCKTLLDSSTLRRFLSVRSYMLHIPNSAEENCLTEKENDTLKSDIKSINLPITKIIVKNSPAFDRHVFVSSQDQRILT